uniref:cAMP-regulated phosphoprotein 21-like n=1 Tax=Sinocyclocheilus rhinocerous TaxID=307959 RepID=A0A673I7E2_9TELE
MGLLNECVCVLQAKGKLVRSTAVCDESLSTEENSKVRIIHKLKTHLQSYPSLEYTDSTGIDLEEFLITTLKSSPRDRLMLLKLEQDMTDFMTDNSSYKKFPQMSSYHRMLVHRVAAYFGLEHNVDHSGKAVIINKTCNSRIPENRFAEHVQEKKTEERRSILKRDNSQEKEDSQLRVPSLKEQMRSKSIEEREEEYQRVRERIFSQDSTCLSQSVYIETRGLDDGSILSETQKRRQLFRGNRDGSGRLSGSRQSSFELDSHWNDPRPWSSTDSDSPTWTSKSAHTRSDSNFKLCKPGAKITPAALHPAYIIVPAESSIPPGSILLNPHTGQPFLNPDGTPAVYNPPVSQKPCNQLNPVQSQAPPPPPQQQPDFIFHLYQQYSQSQLNISTSQQHPIEQTREDITAKFGHMTLSRQSSSGDLPDMSSFYMQGVPPTHSYAPPHHSYAPSHHSDSYITPGMTLAPPTAPAPLSQQSSQVSVYSYPVQCPSASQQYTAASYNTQTDGGTVYPPVMSNQQGCPGMMGSQILPQTQQGIVGPYPSVSSYQQQQQQQSYPAMLVSGQGGQTQCLVPPAGVKVYCSSLASSSPPPLSMMGVSFQSSSCKNGCSVNQNQCWY